MDAPAVPTRAKTEQERCVFAVKLTDFYNLAGNHYGKMLTSEALKMASKVYGGKNFSIKVIHLLFHWNTHSFFTYHQDTDGTITVMINLSHGEASMHVAGYKEATYTGIGSGHIFNGQLWHRSGAAPRRCVKVALFLERQNAVAVDDEPDRSEDKPETETKVKLEEKTEVKSEGSGSSSCPSAPEASSSRKRRAKS